MIIDVIADKFVPPVLRSDMNKREAARFRATARMLVLIILVFIVFSCATFFTLGLDYGLELLVILSAMSCSITALFLIRALRTLRFPLLFANIGTIVIFLFGVFVSGGISSPFIFLFLTIPALSKGFGDRAVFLISCSVIGIAFAGIFAMQYAGMIKPAREDGLAESFQFLMLTGGFVLVVLGGVAAQQAIAQNMQAVRLANQQLSEKNEMLASLSRKLAKYLSPQVYASIFSGKQDVKVGAVRKKLTVYFADIVDFTATTEAMEAEDLANLMNEYFDQMAKIILKHGGTIDKYMGDAIMVFFGDPETQGESKDAINCVRMALEMEDRMSQLQNNWRSKGIARPLVMRAGINTGYCAVGNFGSENRMDYTIIGAQVNVAARLESSAAPGTILMSQHTQALVKDIFTCKPIGEIKVKGLTDAISAFRVIGENQGDEEPKIIRNNVKGLSLFVDPDALSRGDRKQAVVWLRTALDRLEQ